MKDREDRSPVLTSEIMEQEENGDDEARGRSRGKRRTAKEIAQMFEQLKQRHIARKKEWQTEKEDLLKQAALADESKRILVDLKKILEELRVELRSEEKKRIDAQSDHERMREIWNAEKDELLRVIRNLESHSTHSVRQHHTSSQEIDSLKHQLAAQERHLSDMELSNAELRIKMREQQRFFDEEKRKFLESHEGERKNWDKAKQVMLEKIETLQEESRQLQAGAFPLHGSHVASDDQVYLTSPVTDERSSANDEKVPSDCGYSRDNPKPSTREETKYNHFQKTVDEALKQIEKISHDLNSIEVESENKSGDGSRSTPIHTNVTKPIVTSSPRASSRDRYQVSPQVVNHTPSPLSNSARSANGRKVSVTSQEDGDVAGCSRQSDWMSAKSVTSSEAGDKMRDRSNSCKVTGSTTKTSSKLPTRRSSYQTTHVISDVDSPLIASPPTSCSVPGFTESGTDSGPPNAFGSPPKRAPQNSHLQHTSKSELPKRGEVKRRQPNKSPTDFVKVEKRYSTPHDYKPGSTEKSTAKKLPNLHQKLLFHNTDASSVSPQPPAVTHSRTEEHVDKKSSAVHTPYFDPAKSYVKSKFPSSPRMQRRNSPSTVANKEQTLGVPKNLPENNIVRSSGQDDQSNFVASPAVEKEDFPSINVEEAPPPPVRPKPSITIEKDASGNVLRVITDPRFQRQGSPSASPSGEAESNLPVSMTTRRRRSSGNLKEATGFHSPLGAGVEPLAAQRRDEASREKQGKDKSGKNWIKKKLSFLDAPKNSEEKDGGKSPDHKNGSKSRGGRTRSSSLRRADKDRNASSTDSTDDEQTDKNRSKSRRKGKKGNSPNSDEKEIAKGPKSRMRRYTRSKTDTSLEMKNLFSRFRQSQYSPKKPAIVKQFERKLLENEIKALEEKNAEETASTISEGKSSRGSRKVREGDEDGYSGEDELEREISPSIQENKQTSPTVTTTASLTLSKAAPVSSAHNDPRRKSLPSVLPKPRLHMSMVDLRWADSGIIEEPRESQETRQGLKQIGKAPQTNTSPTSDENHSVTALVGKFNTNKTRSGESFVRGAPGRFSLKQEQMRQYRRNPDGSTSNSPASADVRKPKRLSWVSGTKDEDYPTPSWRDKIIAKEDEEPKKSCAGNPPGRRKMSEDMMKKKLNLEKILAVGPKTPRSRRYKRSETQPIETIRRSDDDEFDEDEDVDAITGGVERFWEQNPPAVSGINRSTSLQEFEEIGKELTAPSLQSRFKRPTINNRRPSRWQRKNDH